MQQKDRIRLQHIVDESKLAVSFIQNMTYEDFQNDEKTVRTVIRSLEIIGEAASKISKDLRDKYQEVPWNKLLG